jgi:hypothetical protein
MHNKQAYIRLRIYDGNKDIQLKIIKEVCSAALQINSDCSAPKFSRKMQSMLKNITVKRTLMKR